MHGADPATGKVRLSQLSPPKDDPRPDPLHSNDLVRGHLGLWKQPDKNPVLRSHNPHHPVDVLQLKTQGRGGWARVFTLSLSDCDSEVWEGARGEEDFMRLPPLSMPAVPLTVAASCASSASADCWSVPSFCCAPARSSVSVSALLLESLFA